MLIAPTVKAIVFTDWDGTVTLQDSNDFMTDNIGFGEKRRRELNIEVLEGRSTFRDAFRDMLDSVHKPFPECIEYLKEHIQLDPGFADFYKWAKESGIPVIVVSSGMKPIIHALLVKLVGEDAANNIEIVANDVKVNDDGSWDIVYRDESGFGHDKSRAIKPYAALPKEERPVLFYAGDGVSDLSAAQETDLLFAKVGRDLITYCEREGIPYHVFHTYTDIHDKIKAIVSGAVTLESAIENKNVEAL
ncbi:HAD-like domain-containing protein [Lipomyces tetrasporus]|uniref:HAD-like domain-containing protein n=1 Tax=Lipomyces tetrasporus TaxID=54092 RepID=A0AAD7QQM1_9ASCO|nr:HAD-like domain-containing protein [Lipomyces tetrasporus]KAJ8099694.1 HAD-like domain-containing protein [Lipomyces tetrasporus]